MNKQSDLKEFLENIGTKSKDAYKAVSDRASLYYNMAPDVWNRAGYGGLGGILIGGLIGGLSDGGGAIGEGCCTEVDSGTLQELHPVRIRCTIQRREPLKQPRSYRTTRLYRI